MPDDLRLDVETLRASSDVISDATTDAVADVDANTKGAPSVSTAAGDEVAADVAQATAYGATGVPFFVVDRRYGVSGAQPSEVFAQLLERAWSESQPLVQVAGPGAGSGEACGPDGCPV